VRDPNPHVAGSGEAQLVAAGIACASGLLAGEAREFNRGFFMRCEHGRPFITVKLGMSLDGKVALANGQSQWITGVDARADVQRLRAQAGAILTGSGTLLTDNPQLNVRDPQFDIGERPPLRVIIDSHLRTPPTARLFEVSGEVRIFTTRMSTCAEALQLQAQGAIIETTGGDAAGVALKEVLRRLGELEVNEVLVEAGPTLVGSLLAIGEVDELVLYIAPVLLGAQARDAFNWPVPATLAEAPRCVLKETVKVGADQRVTLRLVSP
jgi:diaminohydroxyphosphoribosylaminopyrimidine deaminase / 5-amino-6-(5-phosphoribosylamino)uracil reductase